MSNASSVPYVFVIVGRKDNPIYEAEWLRGPKREERSHLNQFIIHAALDEVDELKWKNKSMYLGKVDTFNDIHVSSFVTACNFRFMMLHDGRNEDGVRAFFRDAYELALKVCRQGARCQCGIGPCYGSWGRVRALCRR